MINGIINVVVTTLTRTIQPYYKSKYIQSPTHTHKHKHTHVTHTNTNIHMSHTLTLNEFITTENN